MVYDNPHWEYHLPVNPPGAYFREGHDVLMTEIEIANWDSEGGYEFRPRLKDEVQKVSRDNLAPQAARDDEAPELDIEYEDGGYDCD